MKVGDKLQFKKFYWQIVEICKSPYGVKYFKYRVFRKYGKINGKYIIPLSNTKCSYTIFPNRWNFIKDQLKKNKDYHYNMHLWSNAKR